METRYPKSRGANSVSPAPLRDDDDLRGVRAEERARGCVMAGHFLDGKPNAVKELADLVQGIEAQRNFMLRLSLAAVDDQLPGDDQP